ncbi:DNA recombination protein RmuC [Arcticibacter sp. MXS-1]|uniref:DNA recombination protein RmuC n=1 Tax=Arcticibacter sp. MXS-1 TaxID=3341726 RepID=UPI0035A85AFD
MDSIHIVLIITLLVILTITTLRRRQLLTQIGQLKDQNSSLALETARATERLDVIVHEKEAAMALLQKEQDRLLSELNVERQNVISINLSYESTRAYLKSQQEKIAEQKEEIERLHEKFNKDFELLASRILEEKTRKFTETNQAGLDNILKPLKENIKAFEEKVSNAYNAEAAERNVLKGELSKLIELNKQISDEANNLTKALKADNKKQGNWGEVVLDRILEASGLILNESYSRQASFIDDQGNRLQPDVVVHLPDNKNLIIDSKVSLIAYNNLVNCETEEERSQYLIEHINSLKSHIKNLCNKNYCDLYGINSPDFVLLFIPIESSFSVAVQHDFELFEFAWNKRVVVVSPSTLLATLKTISSLWKQQQQTKNAIEIATRAGALYDKFVSFVGDLKKVGDNLDKAREAHNEAFNKLSTGNGNVLSKIEALRKLGAKANKQLDSKYLADEN